MVAVLQVPLAPAAQRVFVENPRTFCISISRQAMRELPFSFVLLPVLSCAPVLVFDDRRQGLAVVEQRRIDELVKPLMRARDGKLIREMKATVRRAHLTRVALAIGYTWPGNPPGYIEFAPDA